MGTTSCAKLRLPGAKRPATQFLCPDFQPPFSFSKSCQGKEGNWDVGRGPWQAVLSPFLDLNPGSAIIQMQADVYLQVTPGYSSLDRVGNGRCPSSRHSAPALALRPVHYWASLPLVDLRASVQLWRMERPPAFSAESPPWNISAWQGKTPLWRAAANQGGQCGACWTKGLRGNVLCSEGNEFCKG